MDKPYYELNPAEFALWFAHFVKTNELNQADLPITAAEIAELTAQKAAFQAKLDTVVAAEQALEAARIALGEEHKTSEGRVSYFNTFYKAKKVPREKMVEMGFKVSDGKNSTPPSEPSSLLVIPNTAGYTDLKWDKNGNKPNTIYDIEAQTDGAAQWQHVESVNTTKYRHLNTKVGEQVVYRVRARRAGLESAWSSPSVAYYKG